MKKILFSLFALFVLSLGAKAQYNQSRFYLGVKAGVNASSVIGEYQILDTRKNNGKVGFVGGVFVEYDIFKWLGVGADVLYSRQGSLTQLTTKNGPNTDIYEIRELHQYLNVPIMVRFTPIADLEIYTGVQPGFMLNATHFYRINDQQEYIDMTSETNPVECSIPVGISYSFLDKLNIDLRYNIGLTDIYKDDDWLARNSVFVITLGYKIEL